MTHGNGPQVGLLALQSETTPDTMRFPLDVLDAESEGMIGYLVEQQLRNDLVDREVVTLLTQVEVSTDDAAFARPTKPIGPIYTEARARQLARERGWTVAPDGDSYRRVVASPEPLAIVELAAVRALLAAGCVVICGGGGGIPVRRTREGLLGVEAVIDKDATSALLAELLGADVLLLLTDVDAVYEGFGTPAARPIHATTVDELLSSPLAAGSMAPKVAAAIEFVSNTGMPAAIGALSDAIGVVHGTAGTRILP